MKPEILVLAQLTPVDRLEGDYILHRLANFPDRATAIREAGPKVRGLITSSITGMSVAELDVMPRLEILYSTSVGIENMAIAEAQRRGVACTYSLGNNTSTCADHALTLLFAIVRDVAQYDRIIRTGAFRLKGAPRPTLSGKKLGILGLGLIGNEVARRAAGGFGMEIGYHNRSQVADSSYCYFKSPLELAEWADFMIVAVPGGAGTQYLVNAGVLEALGPRGFLVNIGRGNAVDTRALIDALTAGRIAGAALDVFEDEPSVPEALWTLPNVLMTPHVAGSSPDANELTVQLMVDNFRAHFQGKPVPTPMPPQG